MLDHVDGPCQELRKGGGRPLPSKLPTCRSAASGWSRPPSAQTRGGLYYGSALRRLDAWLDGRELDDVALAAYLAELHDAGRATSNASMVVAAACFHAKLAGESTPAGERTARVLAGLTGGPPAIGGNLTRAARRGGRGYCCLVAGMRRSEASALRWSDGR